VTAALAHPGTSSDAKVSSYLRAHTGPRDTVAVAFGHPNIVWDAGMRSPYPLLWSLPVRVRDPDLETFDAVLRSTDAPTWVVVSGTSLYTWGVDASAADRTLASRYHRTTRIGRYYVWHVNSGGGDM
jgi:hypothetical protein